MISWPARAPAASRPPHRSAASHTPRRTPAARVSLLDLPAVRISRFRSLDDVVVVRQAAARFQVEGARAAHSQVVPGNVVPAAPHHADRVPHRGLHAPVADVAAAHEAVLAVPDVDPAVLRVQDLEAAEGDVLALVDVDAAAALDGARARAL